jgi:ABC-type transporter Mla subunit MlaD
MTRKMLFIFAVATILISCNKTTTVYFKTNDAKGLEIGDFVMIDEQVIGEVTGFGLTDNGNVIISSEFDTELPIPSNSKFKNSTYSKEGKRCIKITLGNSETPLLDNDTIQLRYSHNKLIKEGKEKLIDKVKGIFDRKDK